MQCGPFFSIKLSSEKFFGSTKELFTLGFFNCINQINKVKPFDVLLIENTSHNDMILKTISIRYQSFDEALASYYFYNYVLRPFLPKDIFLLN